MGKMLEIGTFVKIYWNGKEQIGQIDGRSIEENPRYDIELPKAAGKTREPVVNFPAQAIISHHRFKELVP
jgi:hypothetical protein